MIKQTVKAPMVFFAWPTTYVPALTVSIVSGATFNDALTTAVTAFPATDLTSDASKETTLADGTKAYTAKIKYTNTYGMAVDSLTLGAQKGDKWVIAAVGTVSSMSPYDDAKFSEILNTLAFTK